MTHKLIKTDNYLLVVDDNKDIEENMWTVKDGKVREVSYLGQDNGYAIIAHLPLNSSPILEGVDLLPPIEDDVEQMATEHSASEVSIYALGDGELGLIKVVVEAHSYKGFKKGYNKAREKYKYTEEDVWKAIVISKSPNEYGDYLTINDIIQSLHQYPTEFECEMEWVRDKPYDEVYKVAKTITTAQGVQWVGKYK